MAKYHGIILSISISAQLRWTICQNPCWHIAIDPIPWLLLSVCYIDFLMILDSGKVCLVNIDWDKAHMPTFRICIFFHSLLGFTETGKRYAVFTEQVATFIFHAFVFGIIVAIYRQQRLSNVRPLLWFCAFFFSLGEEKLCGIVCVATEQEARNFWGTPIWRSATFP